MLCDLALKAGVAEKWQDIPVYGSLVSAIWDGEESNPGIPTRKVLDWAGLSNDDSIPLAGLNDSGQSFKQIAMVIEEEL